jgi:hypothetical protein
MLEIHGLQLEDDHAKSRPLCILTTSLQRIQKATNRILELTQEVLEMQVRRGIFTQLERSISNMHYALIQGSVVQIILVTYTLVKIFKKPGPALHLLTATANFLEHRSTAAWMFAPSVIIRPPAIASQGLVSEDATNP